MRWPGSLLSSLMANRLTAGGLVASGLAACSGAEFTSDADASDGSSQSGGAGASGGASGGGGGSATGGSGGGGGVVAGTGGTGGVGTVIRTCPEAPPPLTSACQSGLACTYGDDPRFDCRDAFTCTDGGWTVAGAQCPEVPYCLDRPAPPSNGTDCAEVGDSCYYPEGVVCVCVACTENCTGANEFVCLQATDPCPMDPANVGQPCEGEGACEYAACPSPHHVALYCEVGRWARSGVACVN